MVGNLVTRAEGTGTTGHGGRRGNKCAALVRNLELKVQTHHTWTWIGQVQPLARSPSRPGLAVGRLEKKQTRTRIVRPARINKCGLWRWTRACGFCLWGARLPNATVPIHLGGSPRQSIRASKPAGQPGLYLHSPCSCIPAAGMAPARL